MTSRFACALVAQKVRYTGALFDAAKNESASALSQQRGTPLRRLPTQPGEQRPVAFRLADASPVGVENRASFDHGGCDRVLQRAYGNAHD